MRIFDSLVSEGNTFIPLHDMRKSSKNYLVSSSGRASWGLFDQKWRDLAYSMVKYVRETSQASIRNE